MEFFKKMEIFSELTFHCNYECWYCCQNVDHNDTKRISIKRYQLLTNKLLKEAKMAGVQDIEFSLMGGELSTDLEFLKYFEISIGIVKKLDIKNLSFTFLTNFSGDVLFFNKLQELFYGTPYKLCLNITIHEEYATTEKKINAIISKLNQLRDSDNFIIDITFLKSNTKKYQKMQELINKNKNKIKIKHNIIFEELVQKGKNSSCGVDISKNVYPRYCDALSFSIINDFIINRCTNKKYNFLNFKIDKKLIKCDKTCPCLHMNTFFNQIPLKNSNG